MFSLLLLVSDASLLAWQREQAVGDGQPLPDVCDGDAIHLTGYWWWNLAHFQWPHYGLVKCELIAQHLILSCRLATTSACQPICQLLPCQPLPSLCLRVPVCTASWGFRKLAPHVISCPPATNTAVIFNSFPNWKAPRLWLCSLSEVIKVLEEPCCAWGCL